MLLIMQSADCGNAFSLIGDCDHVDIQVYGLYMYELKDLFSIRASEFRRRVVSTFIPGRHANILQAPDMYGPVTSIFLLPQVIHI